MRRNRVVLLAAVTSLLALSPGGAGATTGPANVVVSTPLGGQYAHDFNNNCVAGYYGTAAQPGNHSESDLAINPVNGSLLGASKFFFGSTADAGYTDFSPWYMFHIGSYSISASGTPQGEAIFPGYADGPGCQGSGDSTGYAWSSSTDPTLAFTSNGDAFAAVLPFTLYTNSQPNGAIFVNRMPAGASSWTAPVLASPFYKSNGTGQGPDKQWVSAYRDPATGTEFVNACWTVFNSWASKVFCSQSTDGGRSFWNAADPVLVSSQSADGPFNTYVYPRYDATGTLYVTYMAEKHEPAIDSSNSAAYQKGNQGVVYTTVSRDHGATFSTPVAGPAVQVLPYQLPNTTFRDGIPYFMYASQRYAGRLFVVTEDYSAGNADVYLYESTDGGATWSATSAAGAVKVNTDQTASDQFQPSITADALGNVGVAWYDRRNACPTGEANTCIDTYVQLFRDGGAGAVTLSRNGGNTRATQFTWDPRQPLNPAQPVCGDDLPHPEAQCGVSFIGDYFGTALGNGNLYVLNVSTHDYGGNPNQAQQQLVQVVPIPR